VDIFDVHGRLVADYDAFTSSLVQVRDDRIAAHLADQSDWSPLARSVAVAEPEL
jgi:hypothetical protein